MSCGVDHKHSSDPALLWLWSKPAATAPIGPLAWEPPYDECGPKKQEKQKKDKKKKSDKRKTFTPKGKN